MAELRPTGANAAARLCARCAQRLTRAPLPTPPPPCPDPAPAPPGLPVVVKDTMAVKGVRFTFGSRLFADNIADEDDPMVEVGRLGAWRGWGSGWG
jgi:hypothetical protein